MTKETFQHSDAISISWFVKNKHIYTGVHYFSYLCCGSPVSTVGNASWLAFRSLICRFDSGVIHILKLVTGERMSSG